MKGRSGVHGLTIVEVLIAIVLIAIIFAALAATQVSSLRMTRASQQGSEATQIAVKSLNDLTNEVLARYDDYQLCPTNPGGNSPDCVDTAITNGYSVSHSISRGTGYEASGLILITVNVTGPASASVANYVSCMDFSDTVDVDGESVPVTPTIRVPGVCAP